MQNNIISSKPLFEFSELELKAIGFEHYEHIKNYENSLNLIRTELHRRLNSHVVTTITNNDIQNKTS